MKVWELIQKLEKYPAGAMVHIHVENSVAKHLTSQLVEIIEFNDFNNEVIFWTETSMEFRPATPPPSPIADDDDALHMAAHTAFIKAPADMPIGWKKKPVAGKAKKK